MKAFAETFNECVFLENLYIYIYIYIYKYSTASEQPGFLLIGNKEIYIEQPGEQPGYILATKKQ